jgi:DNA-3-methyladenine glycosylase
MLPLENLRAELERDVVTGARCLVGATLVHGDRRAVITETEAYRGADDEAAHAFGKTRMSNMNLFHRPGTAYIYLNYGIHWMLNLAALPEGTAAGVLIRAAKPVIGFPAGTRLDGPGRLGKAFAIGPEMNGLDLLDPNSVIHIQPADQPVKILVGPRIGITKSKELPWRFADADQLYWISRPHPPRSEHDE